MKHKHYDMIVAKAANMELTILVKFGKEWMISGLDTAGEIISFDSRYEYFLCLPQHNENGQCLHWLNGGEVETDRSFDEFVLVDEACDFNFNWWRDGWFMQEDYKSRIKPKKEKRLIGVNVKTGKTTSAYEYDSGDSYAEAEVRLIKGNMSDWQFIEIEVEV